MPFEESILAGLSKIAEIADVSPDEVALEIIEDFLDNLKSDSDELVKSDVLRNLITTQVFPTHEQAEAVATRYNNLVDKIRVPRLHDGSRARVIEATNESREAAGYWVEIDRN
jgi:hypothetical protein